MKILNFVPLLIWMLGFIFISDIHGYWQEKNDHMRGLTKEETKSIYKREGKAFAKIWWSGSLFWFILGAIHSIGA